MLLIDDAHMSSIKTRDQSITRGIALIDPPLTSPSFSFEVAHTELRTEHMHIPETLAHALGHSTNQSFADFRFHRLQLRLACLRSSLILATSQARTRLSAMLDSKRLYAS